MHAMSGNELSRVRTEFRLRPPEPIKQSPLESREPTLLCNQVELFRNVSSHAFVLFFWFLVFNSYFLNKNTLHPMLLK